MIILTKFIIYLEINDYTIQGGKLTREKIIVILITLILIAEFIIIVPQSNSTSMKNKYTTEISNKELVPVDVNKLLSNAPMAFTENQGQLENDNVRFYVQGGGIWFTDDGVWFELREYVETNEIGPHLPAKNRIFKDEIICRLSQGWQKF